MVLFLTRTYFPEGTNGKIESEGKLICRTIELPWINNEKRISCIPEGKYFIKKRYSAKFKWHLEIVGVNNRTLILFNPANNAPVTKLSGPGLGLMSRKAVVKLNSFVFPKLEKDEKVVLVIT
jgi:hypothetical protein